MAYNHGREDRKWRIWKEAEEKLLRECGVDEATIEQIRIGIVSSIQMIRQFIYISVVSPGGGRAFFDKSITVGFCRYAFCFMAATFSRRFQQ